MSIEGTWAGTIDLGARIPFISTITFEKTANGISAILDVPAAGSSSISLAAAIEGTRLRLEGQAPPPLEKLELDCRLRDATFAGEARSASQQGSASFARVADLESQALEEFAGVYRLDSGSLFSISKDPDYMPKGTLFFVDHHSGRVGLLYPESESSFSCGRAWGIPLPREGSIEFSLVGNGVTGFKWSDKDLGQRSSTKLDVYTSEDVTFDNGDVTLSGTLTLPVGPGLHPAMVLTHGSAMQSRTMEFAIGDFVRDAFAARGIAILAYDKRGVGASTGDWTQAGFEDLAGDALAGVSMLRNRKDIDGKQVGIWGISQGGWIGPLAAATSKDLAFVVSVVGAGVTPRVQDLTRQEEEMRADGSSEEEIEAALAGYKEFWDSLQAGENATGSFMSKIANYDPVLALKQVACPVLAVFGGLDTVVNSSTNRRIFEEALTESGNRDYTTIVHGNGNHLGLVAKTGGPREVSGLRNFVPGYFTQMADWVMGKARLP